MTQSTRKLLGTVLTLLSIVVYAWLATSLYTEFLTGAPTWLLLAYFAVAGLLWVLPAMYIIRWMAKPDRQ
ncbi:MAG: DUF2842 domain-containing protein [Devosia sp.]